MKKLVIVAPLSSLSKRTRLFKLAKFHQNNSENKNIIHFGWERVKNESKEIYLEGIDKKIILSGGGYGGVKTRLLYFIWMIKVFFYSFFIKKNSTVWALGFESAFPVMLVSKIKGFDVIFDDADRFSMLFPLPKFIKGIIEKLEIVTSRNVRYHIIPGDARYDFYSDRFKIIRNMPSKSEVLLAKKIYSEKTWPEAELTIYVNGWLGANRGMEHVLYLAENLKNKSISIILAGKLDCEAAVKLASMSNVTYLGEVSNSEALSAYYASDFVFTYYNPSSVVNCYAESNKWGDAIKTGSAIIVNEEVKTASYLQDLGIALSVPYDDKEKLLTEVKNCIENAQYKNSFIRDVSKRSEFLYFEEQLANVLK